jgi:dihydrofolate reductase
VLIGRTTYNTALSFDAWPYAGKQVVVMTNRPLLPRHGEQAWSGDLPDVLNCLAAGGAREIYLDGGQLVCQALRHALVDRLTLSWVPVVLGRGVRLFAEELPRSQWQLMGTRAFGSGLAQCRYQRVDR